jgi:hypothetical protein
MNQPVLFVMTRAPPINNDEFSYLENTDSERLWMTVNQESLHPFLREPALLELARRQDSRVLDLCERMMVKDDPEEWLLAVFTLGELGTIYAIERLLHHASQCESYRKRIILKTVATILTEEYWESFIKLANIFGVPGILDVT